LKSIIKVMNLYPNMNYLNVDTTRESIMVTPSCLMQWWRQKHSFDDYNVYDYDDDCIVIALVVVVLLVLVVVVVVEL